MRRWRLLFWIGMLLGGLAARPAPLAAQAVAGDRAVCWSGVDGIINPAVADYLTRAVKEADASGCQALVIRLNTPGGLTSSTWQIGEALLNSRVPTVVYVSPQGANAGSAGVFITYAAHLAAMAPNTNIGAAHPVAGGGEDIGDDLRDKITNDAVARITTWARDRGRNVEWAEQAVRKSVSVGSDDALEQNIINIVASDDADLLRQLDGRRVAVSGGEERTLATLNAPRREIGMSWIESILHLLGDPSIATLLLSLGSLGLYFELATPGVGVGGVAGIICIGLGMYGLSILPVNIVGVGLLLVSFVMFAVDIFATNHGALTAGGIAAFVVGALLLIDAEAAPGVVVSRGIIFGIALGLAIVMALIILLVSRTRRLPVLAGINSTMIGERAAVRSPLAPQGTVWAQGALWQARSAEPLEVGDEVEIVGVEGLTLVVRRRTLGALEAPNRGSGGM
jgi:membrane-bound serine protease (ClpP class)